MLFELVCLSDNLKSFLNDDSWCISVNNICFNKNVNLIDYFPLLKQGYAIRNILEQSFKIYAHINCLYKDENIIPNSHITKSFENITKNYLTFSDINTIIDNNVVIMNDDDDIDEDKDDEFLENEKFIEDLANEFMFFHMLYEIIMKICRKVKSTHPKYITLNSILSLAVGEETLVEYLMKYPRMALLCSIFKKDINLIKQLDLRDNSYEAYYLALEIKDVQIINLVSDIIIERMWIEKQVFVTNINSLESESDLPDILYSYSRSVF